MRLLFLPSDLGGGFGHVGRCLALADAARRRGHHCVFVLHHQLRHRTVSRRFPAHLVPAHSRLAGLALRLLAARRRGRRPIYTGFTGLDYQAPRDGLRSPLDVEQRLQRYRRIADRERTDLLVGDTNLLARLLGAAAGLPVVQLVRFASHPDTARMIWWRDPPEGLVPPDTPALFGPSLQRLGLPGIRRAEDLLRGDLHLVPSLPAIEPVPPGEDTVHVGTLADPGGLGALPVELAGLPADRPLVYATLGGGATLVARAEPVRQLVDACAGRPLDLVLSTGGAVATAALGPLPENVRLVRWAPGRTLIALANAVVFHGGYGTMMELLGTGTPSLAIPFHSEQEGNARRLEQLGCGLLLEPATGPPVLADARWPQGRYTWHEQHDCGLTAGAVGEALHRLFTDDTITRRAESLRDDLSRCPGPDGALDLIERLA